MSEITVYTDGAALGNPGKAGYGIVMQYGKHQKEISEAYNHSTNNRMELLAVIVAMESIKNKDILVNIYTDSKYVCDAVNKNWILGWQKKAWKNVKNIDLWKRFLIVHAQHKTQFFWVKGHAGNVLNERCDFLATQAAKTGPWLRDTVYENEQSNNNRLI